MHGIPLAVKYFLKNSLEFARVRVPLSLESWCNRLDSATGSGMSSKFHMARLMIAVIAAAASVCVGGKVCQRHGGIFGV